MALQRRIFFDQIRRTLFANRLSQAQVDGISVILDEWERRRLTDRRWLAYILATTYHETGRTMQPIKEHGGAAYFRRMYDIAGDRPQVARALGNTEPGDGVRFAGRGFVQLTGRANYFRASDIVGQDLIADPDLAMVPEIAAEILIDGMVKGWFTGRRLNHYLRGGATDWRGARRIVNGLDRADDIAGYARRFHEALAAAADPALPHPQEDGAAGGVPVLAIVLGVALLLAAAFLLTGGLP